MNAGELSDFIELEFDFDRFVASRLVPPTDPSRDVLVVAHFEVVWAEFPIGQQTEPPAQFLAVPMAVVRSVVELHIVSSLITLRHRIAEYPIRPSAAVYLDSHTNRPFVVAVWVELDLRGPYRRI